MMFPYNRLNEIFDYVRQDNIVSASQLSVLLNITDRTIRSDIQAINEILEKNGAKIKLKRKAGYYIEINDQEKYNTFLCSIKQTRTSNLELDSSQDRIKYLLNLLLYSVEYISKTNVGVKIIGNEDDKRKCLVENVLSYNFQNYVTGFTKDEYTLFEGIDLDLLKQIISNKLKNAHIKTNDFNFKNLIIHFALMISRIQFDCYINTNNTIKIDDNYTDFIDDIANEIEYTFNITISEGEKKYIYSHLVANTQLNDLVDNDNKIKELVEELLNNIYFDYNFDLRNDEILSHDLFLHFKSILNTKSFALNKRNPLLNTIKTNFPLAFDITLTCTAKIFNKPPYILTEDEVGYITLHVHSAISTDHVGESMQAMEIIHESIDKLRKELNIGIDRNSISYIRLMNHIKYLLLRLNTEEKLQMDISDFTQERFPFAYERSKEICIRLSKVLKKEIPQSEIGYLALHLERILSIELK